MVFGKDAPRGTTLGAQEMEGDSLPSPSVDGCPCPFLKLVARSGGRPKFSGSTFWIPGPSMHEYPKGGCGAQTSCHVCQPEPLPVFQGQAAGVETQASSWLEDKREPKFVAKELNAMGVSRQGRAGSSSL